MKKLQLQQEFIREIVYLSYVQKGDFIRHEINLGPSLLEGFSAVYSFGLSSLIN